MNERRNSVSGPRRGIAISALSGLAALVLFSSACGSSDPAEMTLSSSSSDVSGDEDSPTTSETATSTEEGNGSQDESDEVGVDTTETTVRNGVPRIEMDEEVLREELFSRVKEAREAFLACVDIPEECDFENDFAPLASGPYKAESEEAYLGMLQQGLQARIPDTDETFYVDHLPRDLTPFQAIVRVCFQDTGVIVKPGQNGAADEVINDNALAKTVDYLVREDLAGNLRIDDRDQIRESEDLALCDEYS